MILVALGDMQEQNAFVLRGAGGNQEERGGQQEEDAWQTMHGRLQLEVLRVASKSQLCVEPRWWLTNSERELFFSSETSLTLC